MFFVVEVIFVAWEAVYIEEMRNLEQEGFEPLSENKKRRKYSTPMKYVSLLAMFIFIFFLLAGGLLTTRRECLP